PEDLRVPFERYGPVKDVYLPKNYYTGEPRGFGFVKFRYGEDAAEAKQRMNHQVIGGREIRIVFAEENRKTPQEMLVEIGEAGEHRLGPQDADIAVTQLLFVVTAYSRSPSPAGHDSRPSLSIRHNAKPPVNQNNICCDGLVYADSKVKRDS
ncbi:hypothetical protein Goari_003126, partial [Gossypium aridum]|nr:hypothetical protein [Gossypium aridum]